jgi:hypothetical protein
MLEKDQEPDENTKEHNKSYMIDNEKAHKIIQYLKNDFTPNEKPRQGCSTSMTTSETSAR